MEAMRQEWSDDRIAVLDRKVEDGFRRVESRFDRIDGEIGQIKEEIGQIKGGLGQIKEEIGEIKGELDEVNGELKALRDDVGSRLEAMHHTMLQFCVGAVAILGAAIFTLAGIVMTQV